MNIIYEKVVALIAAARKIDPKSITKETTFITDLKMDSMSIVQAVLDIEDKYDIEIPEKLLFKMKSVGDLVSYLEQKVTPAQLANMK